MSIRDTLTGKQVIWLDTLGVHTTLIGKQLVDKTAQNTRSTLIGKQVIWTDSQAPAPPPTPPVAVAPSAVPARGGSAYVDSFLEYDGRNSGATDGLFPGVRLTVSGGTTWGPGESLTITASTPAFVSGDNGGVVLILHELNAQGLETGTVVRFTITGFSSSTVVTGTVDVTVPTDMRGATLFVWDRAVNAVAGLDHLEASPVSILADEHIVASVYDTSLAPVTVSSGTVTLPDFYADVVVGLPYYADLETLDIERPTGPSTKMAKQNITRVGCWLEESRSFWVGTRAPSDDLQDPLENLYPMFNVSDAKYETELTSYHDLNVKGGFDESAHVFIRSIDPVPMGIGAILPMGFVDSGGT